MDTQKFIKAENVDMLWEILLDEPFKNTPKEEMNNLRQYFNNEIKLFYNTHINNKSSKFNLLSLNQMFLEKIVPQQNHVKQQQQQQQQQSYKAEDLQADRMSQFENQLTQKRQEFENAITLKKPQVPNFSDTSKSEHIPINEMEALIAQTLAQRNFDISQINNNKTTDATNWLKPAETSIKTEKQQDNNAAIKYIKIGREQLPTLTNEIIDINEPSKQEKKISWIDESNTTSIFSKLKLKPTIETPSYEMQSGIHVETQFEILNQRIEKLENIVHKLIEQKQSPEYQYH